MRLQLPCSFFYEKIYLNELKVYQTKTQQRGERQALSQSRSVNSQGRFLAVPNTKFSEQFVLNGPSSILLLEAEMCISKIKMQVSGIDLAHQKHSQLFSQGLNSSYGAAKLPKVLNPQQHDAKKSQCGGPTQLAIAVGVEFGESDEDKRRFGVGQLVLEDSPDEDSLNSEPEIEPDDKKNVYE